MIKVYVVGIANPEKKPSLKISRTHKDLVKRLFEMEVPEIADGVVEVMNISRVAGSRSKIAVRSKDKNVDAVGACIGPKKSRISAVVGELNGEKIDIIPYSDDPAEFIARALAPAQVIKVKLLEDSDVQACRVVVPTNQLSLAIGNKGQNARLAAGLTGYKIDIISDVQAKELEAEEQAAAEVEAEAEVEEETVDTADTLDTADTAETETGEEITENTDADTAAVDDDNTDTNADEIGENGETAQVGEEE
jgi:N utilization substance protein A